MATIYNLVTQLTADPAPMKAGFDQGIALINSFASSAANVLSKPVRNATTGQYAKFGVDAANAVVTNLQSTFEAQQTKLKEAFARGALSAKQFEDLGVQDAKAFNRTLLTSLDTLDASKVVPPEARAALVNALKDTGTAAAAAFDPITSIGQKLRSFGRDLTQIGRELSLAITAPLALGAAAVIAAAETMQHAIAQIKTSTGATGAALAGLTNDFNALFKSVPDSAKNIATALSSISQISGATGPALQQLATQALDLSRITGTDLTTNIQASQHAFQAWGITVAQQGANLDTLFKVSQQTGVTVADLAGSVARFAPAMRQFGLTFTQSAALIGQFQKSGIDADAIFTTLQTSLSKFADRGVDGAHALQLLITSIKGASSDAEAVNLAGHIFGPRQATQLAAAIRTGQISIDALTASVRASSQTVSGAAKDFDPFTDSMTRLKNAATTAIAPLGDALQKAFVDIEPAITSAIKSFGDMAKAFDEFPTPVRDTVLGFLGFIAVLGPAVLALGGIVKAFGALDLAIGLIRGKLGTLIFGQLATESVAAASGAEAAAGAVGVFASGLTALAATGVVVAVITAIYLAFEHFTKSAHDAADRLDDFTKNVQVLNGTQLNIQTSTIRAQLEQVNNQIRVVKAALDAQTTHPTSDFDVRGQTDELNRLTAQATQYSAQLEVIGNRQEDIRKKTSDSADQLNAFNKAVSTLIQSSGQNIKIDASGAVTGSAKDLQATLDALNKHSRLHLSIDGANETQQAIEDVTKALIIAGNVKKPSLQSIFGIDAAAEVKTVNGLISRTQALGDSLSQLNDIKLSAEVIAEYQKLATVVAGLGDRTDESAVKFRTLFKSIKDTAAAQLATNTDNSGSFRLNVTGVITKVTADRSLDAQNNFLDMIDAGLGHVKQAAEQAATATDALNAAYATGNPAAIKIALDANTAYYAALQKDLAAYDAQLANSGRSRGEIQRLQALAQTVVTSAGASPQLAVKLNATRKDTQDFMDGLQAMIDALPGVIISLQTTLDLKSVHDAALAASKEIQAAQLQALAGNTGGATAATTKTIDDFAKRIQALAQSTATGTLDQQSLAFRQIAKDASDAGISIDQVLKALQAMTALGKLSQIANTFASLASELTGANSALTQFAGGFAKAITGAVALSAAIKEIKAENLSALSNAGNASVSGLGSLAGALSFASAAGSIISGISGLVTTIGGLFGESQLDKEHDAILKSNNAALAQLTQSLDRNAGTPGELDTITKAITNAISSGVGTNQGLIDKLIGIGGASAPSQTDFTNFLHSIGLTFAEVDAQAKAFGITLSDGHGSLVGLQAFMDALAKDAILLTTLGHDLSTQQAIIAAQNAVNNTPTTAQGTLDDSLTAIEKTLRGGGTILSKGSSAIADQLQAAAGQGTEALRAALKNLVAEIVSGQIKLSDLGSFKDVNELLQAITGAAGNLNALAGAADSVTSSLLNVPAGFKKALAEFNAQLPQTGPTVPTSPSTPPTAPPVQPLPTDTTPTRGPDPTVPILLDIATHLQTIVGAGKVSGQPAAIGGPLRPVNIPGKAVSLSLIDPQDIPPLLIDGSLITIAAASSVVIPAPVFHVEQSAPVQLAAPLLSVQPLAPVSLAAPSVSLTSGLADIKLASPVVAVRPFAPVTLAAPQISVGDVQPVTIRAPRVTVGSAAAIKIPAPSFVVPDSTQTLTVQAPAVRVSGPLASVVLSPPPVAIGPYSASVPISPPAVKVGALAPVALRAPSVTIPDPSPVAVAAPVVRVQALASVHLPRPDVIVEPLKPVALDAPKVTVSPLADLTLKSPGTLNAPSFNVPQLQAPSDRPLMSDVQLTKALTTIAQQQANAPLDGTTGDVHLHDPVFYIDAKSKTAKQMFDDVKQQAQKLAHQKTGDSTRVVDAFAQ